MGACCGKDPDPFEGGGLAGMMSKADRKKLKAEMKKAGMNPNNLNDMGALFGQAFSKMGQALQQAAEQIQKQNQGMKAEEIKKIEEDSFRQLQQLSISINEQPPHYYSDESDRSENGITLEDVNIEFKGIYDELASKNLNDAQLSEALKQEKDISHDITGLDLSGNKISEQIIPLLLEKFPGIVSLSLACNEMESLDKLAGYLKNSKIVSLALGGNQFTVESVINFVEQMSSSSLKHLGLVGLNLKDQGAIAVMRRLAQSNITFIDLSLNGIKDAGLQEICQIGYSGQVMHLSRNYITPKGFQKFTKSIEKFPNLKYFDIRGNQLNDRGATVDAFLELKRKDIIFKLRSNAGISWKVITELSAMNFTVEKGAKIDEKRLLSSPFNS